MQKVKVLIKNKGLKPEVIDEVFEIKMGGYGATGGRRRFKRTMRKGVRSSRRRFFAF